MASPQSGRTVIDLIGDTLITLNNSGEAFAVWTEPLDIASHSGDTRTEDMSEDKLPGWVKWNETEPEHDQQEQSEQPSHPSTPSPSDAWIQETLVRSTAVCSAKSKASTPIIYRVSSAHLITASPKFKHELKFSRDHQKDGDDFCHLEGLNWDPEAFEVLLNTLHTRYRKVPRQLTLEMLAKVAVMVEHYQCWEAFELISQTWIKHIRMHHPIPLTYNRDLVLWMLVAWVFKLPKEFTKTTALALRQCTDPSIQDMGLRIPSSILRTLEIRRSEVIEQILEAFNYWIDEFSDTYTCRVDENLSFECSSILLGALMKQIRSIGVLTPGVAAPFKGFSIETVYESIKLLKSPIWETYDEVNELYPRKHVCGFQGTIIRDVEHILERVKGLLLTDFMDYDEDIKELTFRCS